MVDVVEIPATVPLPSADYFDFLLFDEAVALVHDYGTGTRDTGRAAGWSAIAGSSRPWRTRHWISALAHGP